MFREVSLFLCFSSSFLVGKCSEQCRGASLSPWSCGPLRDEPLLQLECQVGVLVLELPPVWVPGEAPHVVHDEHRGGLLQHLGLVQLAQQEALDRVGQTVCV